MIYRVDEMEALIRAALEIPAQEHMSSATILRAINDGMKDVAALTSCIEHEDLAVTVAGNRLVPFSGYKVNFVEYL